MTTNKGQSLIELLVAVSVGTLLILGVLAVISPALRTNKDVEHVQVGTGIARELLDDVKVFSEKDWHNISNLPTGSNNKYFFNKGSSTLVVATGTEGVVATGIVNGLIGHWKFDEATGTTAYDFSDREYDATIYNDVVRSSGVAAGGVQFGGVSSYVEVNDSADLRYEGGNMTFSAWVFPDPSDPDRGYILNKPWNGVGQNNYNFYSSGGPNPTFTFEASGETTYNLGFIPSVSAGVWHNLIAVLSDTSAVRLFLDGKLSNIGTQTILNWNPPGGNQNRNLVFGCVYPSGVTCGGSSQNTFKGFLDEVRIYDRALSDLEVNALYNSMIFERSFYVENVSRDGSGSIVEAGGNNDPSTKKIIVNYRWLGAVTSTISKYITRAKNKVYVQTDWSGGSGQANSTTTINSRFASSTNVNYSSSTGSIKINL